MSERMLARGNRTFICSVVFIDIVEYSKKPVAEQIQVKERLNAQLAEALKDVAANDRIILDTGDGAAISFVGDPEEALFVCLALRDMLEAPQPEGAPPLTLRVGINLGPVKLVRDLNSQPNIIGDGINVAQRVMSFADPNQILVSRSYYEVVSCLSDAYAKLFRYLGSRTDKHVREHEVYAVGESTSEIKRPLEPGESGTPGMGILPGVAQTVIQQLSQSATQFTENLRYRPKVGTAMVVVAILVVAVVLRGLREPPEPATVPEAPPPVRALPAPVAPPSPPPKATAQPPSPPPKAVAAPAKPAPEKAVRPPAKPAPEPRPAAPAAEPAIVALAISPWGEIYVNGKLHGVSPPLREVQVSPGRHKIEVKNTTFATYVETVEVQAGDRIRIRHKFR